MLLHLEAVDEKIKVPDAAYQAKQNLLEELKISWEKGSTAASTSQYKAKYRNCKRKLATYWLLKSVFGQQHTRWPDGKLMPTYGRNVATPMIGATSTFFSRELKNFGLNCEPEARPTRP
jgi:hypothetical protein